MNHDYPVKDFPWCFYFNGEVMPKWGACWGMAEFAGFLQVERDADQEVGHRDVSLIYGRIDHVGVVESADPEVFVYAAQEALQIFLNHRDSILTSLRDKSRWSELAETDPPDVYSGLVESAFRMRDLAEEKRCAFWTSGYEADRLSLVEVMRRSQLPADSPDFMLSPHLQRLQWELNWRRKKQIRQLHKLAQSGEFDKEVRRRLHEMRLT